MVKINVPSGVAAIKDKMAKAQKEEKEITESITGLTDDAAPPIQRIQDAVDHLNMLWEQQDVPVASIKVGLTSVLKLIKSYDDVAMELEPETIQDIVATALKLTDEETRTIFDKANKKGKKKKPTPNQTVKDIMKAVKEDKGDDDLGALDDLVF